jgi:hypothetical protein
LVLDPPTWAALERCLSHRGELRTLNSHLLVTRNSSTRSTPVSPAHLCRVLDGAGVSLRALRSTRLSRLVGAHDPLVVAAAYGVTPKAALYYLGDAVDHEYTAHLEDRLASG